MEHHRQSLMTSNEAYGEFWSQSTPRYNIRDNRESFHAAGLPSDHEELDRHRQGENLFMTPGYLPDKSSPRTERRDFTLPPIPSARPRCVSPPLTSYRSPRVDLSKKIDFSSSNPNQEPVQLAKDFDDRLVARFDSRTDLHMPDIKSIDITVHLKDNTSVMLKSMPFTYWDQIN